jgi:hypothetical protein
LFSTIVVCDTTESCHKYCLLFPRTLMFHDVFSPSHEVVIQHCLIKIFHLEFDRQTISVDVWSRSGFRNLHHLCTIFFKPTFPSIKPQIIYAGNIVMNIKWESLVANTRRHLKCAPVNALEWRRVRDRANFNVRTSSCHLSNGGYFAIIYILR